MTNTNTVVSKVENTFALSVTLKQDRKEVSYYAARIGFIENFMAEVHGACIAIARVIDKTRPLCVPMTWSMYPERIWNPNYQAAAVPCLSINPAFASIMVTDSSWERCGVECVIHEAMTIIDVRCEPSIETHYRWGNPLMSSFFTAMRAVKERYNIKKWEDCSRLNVSSYENVALVFKTSRQAVPITFVSHAAGYKQTMKVGIEFSYVLPMSSNAIEGKVTRTLGSECSYIEEDVTITKRVKKLVCNDSVEI